MRDRQNCRFTSINIDIKKHLIELIYTSDRGGKTIISSHDAKSFNAFTLGWDWVPNHDLSNYDRFNVLCPYVVMWFSGPINEDPEEPVSLMKDYIQQFEATVNNKNYLRQIDGT